MDEVRGLRADKAHMRPRQVERTACSFPAQVCFRDGSPGFECEVTDLSASGARILWPADQNCPATFDLRLSSNNETRHALLRWQTAEAVGVEFAPASSPASTEAALKQLAARVTYLEETLRSTRAAALLRDVRLASSRDGSRETASSDIAADLGVSRDGFAEITGRVSALERRNDEILQALRRALQLLNELRNPAVAAG